MHAFVYNYDQFNSYGCTFFVYSDVNYTRFSTRAKNLMHILTIPHLCNTDIALCVMTMALIGCNTGSNLYLGEKMWSVVDPFVW